MLIPSSSCITELILSLVSCMKPENSFCQLRLEKMAAAEKCGKIFMNISLSTCLEGRRQPQMLSLILRASRQVSRIRVHTSHRVSSSFLSHCFLSQISSSSPLASRALNLLCRQFSSWGSRSWQTSFLRPMTTGCPVCSSEQSTSIQRTLVLELTYKQAIRSQTIVWILKVGVFNKLLTFRFFLPGFIRGVRKMLELLTYLCSSVKVFLIVIWEANSSDASLTPTWTFWSWLSISFIINFMTGSMCSATGLVLWQKQDLTEPLVSRVSGSLQEQLTSSQKGSFFLLARILLYNCSFMICSVPSLQTRMQWSFYLYDWACRMAYLALNFLSSQNFLAYRLVTLSLAFILPWSLVQNIVPSWKQMMSGTKKIPRYPAAFLSKNKNPSQLARVTSS